MSGGPPPTEQWASEVLGYISFVFTLATVIRVFWDSLNTFWGAPVEIPNFLVTVKQELYEEREYLRRARRRERAELLRSSRSPSRVRGNGGGRLARTMTGTDGGAPVKAMSDSLRRLCREFRELERPFLSNPDRQQDEGDDFDDVEKYPTQRPGSEYACQSMDVRRRISWTWRKGQAVEMLRTLTRMQTRRITREVSDVLE
ncbi:MAG: hypothetical protein M4579_006009 [Chaenotheca gracillima]|nr:MAG: hypothetical protein M4579_006009 [Chaenotheca gracillima]